MEEYSSTCHGWMIYMDENWDEKWQWMNFPWTFATSFDLRKIEQKKFMLVYCDQFVTWNVQVILELVFHIPVLQHPNHIKFGITSNSKAQKPIDPLKGMCRFKQYLSTTKRYATIKNWDNIKYPKTPLPL